jgi:tetratricopeptide (TPR) repeat protein
MNKGKFASCLALASVALIGGVTGCNRSPQAKEAAYLKRAEGLEAKKDYARAILELRNAMRVMPRDAEPYYRTALLEVQMGQPGVAARDLAKAIDLNPNHEGARLKLAEMMALSSNKVIVEDSAKRAREIIASSPNNLEAVDTLAFTQWRLGNGETAENLLEEALTKFPSHLQSSVALARVRLSRKDFAGAEQALKDALANAPKSATAALALSRLYIVVRKLDLAESLAARAVQLDASNGLALLTLAALQVEGGRKDQAEQTYKRLSALPDKRYKSVHAMYLYQLGRQKEAIAEFASISKADPDDRVARGRLVAAYTVAGQVAEARRIVEQALKQNPKDGDALVQHSTFLLQDGNTAQAEQELRSALHSSNDSAQAHWALARLYHVLGRAPLERQELQEVVRLRPDMLGARLQLARGFTISNDPASALAVLDQTPPRQKRTQAVIVERNWALRARNDWPAFRTGVEDGLALGRSPDLLLQDGMARMNQGNYAAAGTDAEEILKQSPGDARGAGLLAESLRSQKQIPKALETLRKLTAENPKSAPLQKLYGDWLQSTGDRATARGAYRAAKAADAKYIEADFALVGVDIADNHNDAARQTLMELVKTNPGNVTALLLLGGVEPNPADAMAHYRKVIEIDERNVTALNNLAYMMALEDPDGALKYGQQAMELSPDSAMVQDTLGWIYYRKGVYERAVQYLQTAVTKEPTPRRQFHLALSYIKHGDKDRGRDLMQSALAKDPNLPKSEQGW